MPDAAVDNDILMAAVQLACRAPSLHNSQPLALGRRGCEIPPVR
jgi:nitroreductase